MSTGGVTEINQPEGTILPTSEPLTSIFARHGRRFVEALEDVETGIPVIDVVIGAVAGVTHGVLLRDLDEGVEKGLEVAIPFSEVLTEASEGDIDGSIKAAFTETASTIGTIGGVSLALFLGAPALSLPTLAAALIVGTGAKVGSEEIFDTMPRLPAAIRDISAKCMDNIGIDSDAFYSSYVSLTEEFRAVKDNAASFVMDRIKETPEHIHGFINDEQSGAVMPRALHNL